MRILLSEQTFGSIGLFNVVGLNNDQLIEFSIVLCIASLGGIVAAMLTLTPDDPGRSIRYAALLIALGAFIDASSNNLTRPEQLYFSQGLIAFASLYFLGPAMVIGIARMLLAGPHYFVSFVVLFGITQNLGGLLGSALFGTFQVAREKFHSHEIVQQMVMTDPLVAARIESGAGLTSRVVLDPSLRGAEGAALLAQQVTREANVLAFNDVFIVVGALACLAFLWGLSIKISMQVRGEESPARLLQRRMQQAANQQ